MRYPLPGPPTVEWGRIVGRAALPLLAAGLLPAEIIFADSPADELSALAERTSAASVSAPAIPRPVDVSAPGGAGDSIPAAPHHRKQFLEFARRVIEEGQDLGNPDNPEYALRSSIGLSDAQIKAIAAVGGQGDAETCTRYAIAAALLAAGGDITVEDMKTAAQAVQLSRGDYKIGDDKVFQIYAMSKHSLRRARGENTAFQDELRSRAENTKMWIGDEDIARAAGYQVLVPGGLATETLDAFAVWFESDDSRDAERFFADSARLRDDIAGQLAKGRPVVASVALGRPKEEYGGMHSVTVVRKGENAAGTMMVQYYNPWGTIDAIPWADFYPLEAMIAQPAVARAAPPQASRRR